MPCTTDLLLKLDAAAENYEFPGWECGEQNAFVGRMRASGFTSRTGVALVFEDFEYSLKEGVLQSIAFGIATFPVPTWIQVGRSVQVDVSLTETQAFPIDFGTTEVQSRGRSFSVALEQEALIAQTYLAPDADALTPEAVLLELCDTIPADWLFSSADDLKALFEMEEEAQRLFVVDAWQHLSHEELYGEEIKPSSLPDLVAMAEAVCTGRSSPALVGIPNTSWQSQCKEAF